MKINLRRAARLRLPKRERAPLYVPRQPDYVWSADFMADALTCGRRFRLFNIVDDFNREVVHIEVDNSITSKRLVRVFERLRQERDLPQVLRSDNGPDILGKAFISWAKAAGMALQYIKPGKPNRNGYIERFNRTLREEQLDAKLFLRLDDVREVVSSWRIEYNEQLPHDALGGTPPAAYRIKNAGNSTYKLSA
jgi:putative transposase